MGRARALGWSWCSQSRRTDAAHAAFSSPGCVRAVGVPCVGVAASKLTSDVFAVTLQEAGSPLAQGGGPESSGSPQVTDTDAHPRGQLPVFSQSDHRCVERGRSRVPHLGASQGRPSAAGMAAGGKKRPKAPEGSGAAPRWERLAGPLHTPWGAVTRHAVVTGWFSSASQKVTVSWT